MSIIYLVKDSNSLISHCYCKTARVGSPCQISCPWCGCGWLFSCIECGMAFTFARAKEIDATWEEMAWRDLSRHSKEEPDPEEVDEAALVLREMHEDLEVGRRYVYFDGLIVPVDADGIHGEGLHAEHDLDYVPQVAALRDRSRIKWVLENIQYWESNSLSYKQAPYY